MKHRRFLALITLPLVLSVGACGSSGSGSGGSQDDSAATSYKVLDLVSAKGAGGTAASALTWLQTPASRDEYAAQFTGPLEAKLSAAFASAKPAAGQDLFASIVSVGCGAPTDAVVFHSFDGVVVQASPSPDASGCTTPTTTVAVVAGPPPE
ncbi:hypothetical protein [Nocardioides sp. Kera G14]|uniref:hypothetical protein n=1 Tax=Nocardioides sp. Kera G14 TaxID=2884264 RepID=UPI001D10F017|nr:hypothetical protein [Nocardioides sp. Kera G14]UDY23080.1 hypothetical protein LH076_13565 [Nocardioides sp. Kera G14]